MSPQTRNEYEPNVANITPEAELEYTNGLIQDIGNLLGIKGRYPADYGTADIERAIRELQARGAQDKSRAKVAA